MQLPVLRVVTLVNHRKSCMRLLLYASSTSTMGIWSSAVTSKLSWWYKMAARYTPLSRQETEPAASLLVYAHKLNIKTTEDKRWRSHNPDINESFTLEFKPNHRNEVRILENVWRNLTNLFSVLTNFLDELKRCFRLLETDCFLLGFCSLEASEGENKVTTSVSMTKADSELGHMTQQPRAQLTQRCSKWEGLHQDTSLSLSELAWHHDLWPVRFSLSVLAWHHDRWPVSFSLSLLAWQAITDLM